MRALGIDVGVARGLDLVLLEKPRSPVEVCSHVTTADLPPLIAELRPDAIAIDSPPCFSKGAPRKTEVAIRKRGISLYATPWEDEKKTRSFYDWMRVGFQTFAACSAAGFPLFRGHSYKGSALEVFPYSAAVVLSGGLRPNATSKKIWRLGVLKAQGVDTAGLRSVDQIDAALAALTGLLALEGHACWQGEPSEGVIILPCHPEDLRAKYVAP